MALRTAEQYFKDLRRDKKKVFILGKEVPGYVDHPLIKPSISCIGQTFKLAEEPKYEGLLTAKSGFVNEDVSRFNHIHQDIGDLVKKVKMLRILGQETASCFQRCVGFDAMNAVFSVTYDLEKKYGKDYHARFREFLKHMQRGDLLCGGVMTDVKGVRSLRPSQQPDPDMYVRIVEEKAGGIVVRGAKANITGAVAADELLVMPTTVMREDDRAYAVCFAIPADSKGLIYVLGRQPTDSRRMEGSEFDFGNPYGATEAMIIFDDVFVPEERIFMRGEHEFASSIVERFSSYHRQCYGGCKSGLCDVLIGAVNRIAKILGIEKSSNFIDKITQMVHLNETMWSCSLACSHEGFRLEAGSYLVNLALAQVCKLNVTEMTYEIARLAEDLAGGALVTSPSEMDLKNPVVGKFIKKYYKGVPEIPAEERLRLQRLIEFLCYSHCLRTEAMHGAGSPAAQRIMLRRYVNLEEKSDMAMKLAGLKE